MQTSLCEELCRSWLWWQLQEHLRHFSNLNGFVQRLSENDFSSRQILEGLVVQLLHSSFVRSIYCSIYVQFIEGGMNQPLADGHWPPRPHLSGIKLGFLSVCHYHYLFLVLLWLTTIIIIIIVVSSITVILGLQKDPKSIPPWKRRAAPSRTGDGREEVVRALLEAPNWLTWDLSAELVDALTMMMMMMEMDFRETHRKQLILFSANVESNKGSPWISIFFSRNQVAGPDGPARGQPPRGQAPLIAAAAAGHASVKLKQFSLHRDFLSDWKKSDILWFCLTFKQVELGLPFFLSDLRPEKDWAFLPWKPARLCSAAAGSPCQRACHDNGTDQCSASGSCQGCGLETDGNRWTDGIGWDF